MATSDLVPVEVSRNIAKYLPYLVEIRNRFLFIGLLFLSASIVGFSFYERITGFILKFFSFEGVNIVFTTPFQFFSLALNCGLAVGVVVVIPIVVFQLLNFLKPALKPKEYRLFISILPLSMILFSGGFVYGVTMMKYVVQIFYQSSLKLQIGNFLDVEDLLSSILVTGVLLGISFLFPIFMTILMQLKIIKHQHFVKQRAIAYLIGIVFVILLPPPDLLSDIILFTPLAVLFELTLILNRIFLKTHTM